MGPQNSGGGRITLVVIAQKRMQVAWAPDGSSLERRDCHRKLSEVDFGKARSYLRR